ncbi:MAG: branched-chain amino acid ABC transporter ATP-binding protein/permease [Actinomycetota bacterium]|nr:branched-chain amino acid ABC transporter ATP-binding protein/permease [Actinomycetota bacterium]
MTPAAFDRYRRPKDVGLILLGCIVLPPLTGWAMPGLLSQATALTLTYGVCLGIAALSLNLLLGYAGQLSLGHAALLGVGAFGASLIVDGLALPMFIGWAVGACVGAAVALAIGIPALRLRGLYLALVTLVFGSTMQASVLRWRVFTHGSAGASLPRRLWGEHILINEPIYLSMVLVVLVGVWLVDINVLRTRIGRAFLAIREDETAAQAFGIDVTRYKLLAFVLSGAIAGLAGALYGGAVGLVNSDVFDRELSLRIVLFVIIGGVGRRWGCVAVSVLLAVAPKLPDPFKHYDLVIAAGITLYNVVKLPEGLAGFIFRIRNNSPVGPAVGVEELRAIDLAAVARTPPPSAERQVLTVSGLSVDFGGLRAVHGMSLTVRTGSIVGVIGPNGAGKSTLFNAISGFVPSTGTVTLDGAEVQARQPHERVSAGLGRTFQNVGLARDQTVRNNILLAQHLKAPYGDLAALGFSHSARVAERELGQLADEVIGGLGFERYADTPVRELSGGQQRLVELAAVLATGPMLLMLDEPTAGLSPAAAESLAERLRQLQADRGQTILLIEHNVPLVLDLCHYIYVMSAGELLAEGTPDELSARPEILDAYLGGQVFA